MKTNNKIEEANSIIKNHMMWSMGAGFIPVPIADVFAVSAIQLDMIRQMCNLYEVNYKQTEGKAVISSLTGSVIARVGARAVKFIPGVGSVIGGVTLAVLSGASTYALGEVFKKHFETGGTFLDFDPARLKKMYDEMFEKGKTYAKKIKNEQAKTEVEAMQDPETASVNPGDIVKRLRDLANMQKEGLLSAEEFELLKKRIVEN
ncbi:MAG: DUF697 domain-containing protein [Saprospiraceae bacterium]|nr:DUF697 domain-containing protein [Saprospiraceae bacterium]